MSRVTIKPAVTDRRYNGENTELGLLMRMTSSRIFRISVLLLMSCYPLTTAGAQDLHSHTPGVSGVPQGIPYFCANPTVTSSGTMRKSNACNRARSGKGRASHCSRRSKARAFAAPIFP